MTDEAKIDQQRQLYGAPLGALVRRVGDALGLTQSGIASVLGLSPAMLSQLATGQRVKIGNPAVVARLQALLDLAEDAPSLPRTVAERRLEEIRVATPTLTTSRSPVDPVDLLRRSLRAVASGRELEQAALALDAVAPGIAELVRVYGTGTRAEAEAHHRSIRHLLDDR